MDAIRVLIADDHPFFRDGLRVLIDSAPDMEIVGEAATGDEAISGALEHQPDVVLMDLKMPGIHGIDATRQITQSCPHIRILVVTMFEDDESVFAAMRAGARGYTLKGADRKEMLVAIRAVAQDEAIFGPAIARRLKEYFAPHANPDVAQVFPDLTEREVEILDLIAAGLNNTEISDRLILSLKTVRNYVSSIFSKLQVADRAQAIVRARDAGMGQQRAEPPGTP